MLDALDALESREFVRESPHVAAALHVVLSADGDEAGAPPAHVSGEEREVDEGENVVGGVVVLGDAEGPAELGPVGSRVGVGELADRMGRHRGELLGPLERIGLDRSRVSVEARGRVVDERPVLEARLQDLAPDGVGERDVGADVDAEP
jgi:hypothetical protein